MVNNYISRLMEYIDEGYCLEHVSISGIKKSDRILTIELKYNGKSKTVTYKDNFVPIVMRFIKKEFPDIRFIEV